jgi:hypothetical protein
MTREREREGEREREREREEDILTPAVRRQTCMGGEGGGGFAVREQLELLLHSYPCLNSTPCDGTGHAEDMTVWPSGLRRWLQAPVRKGVGSNPTAVNFQTGPEAIPSRKPADSAAHDSHAPPASPSVASAMQRPIAGPAASSNAIMDKSADPGRTRTCNLWFRRPTPYPLGHRASCSSEGHH